jgi:hypothetical protein
MDEAHPVSSLWFSLCTNDPMPICSRFFNLWLSCFVAILAGKARYQECEKSKNEGWDYQMEGKQKLVFSSNAHKIARIWFVQEVKLVLLSL